MGNSPVANAADEDMGIIEGDGVCVCFRGTRGRCAWAKLDGEGTLGSWPVVSTAIAGGVCV